MIHGQDVEVPVGDATITGTWTLPQHARGIVVFAHGSGSSRFSSRNLFVANALHDGAFATLLLDLLTPQEERVDVVTAQHRFDIELLARRLIGAVDWLIANGPDLPIGLFGASTGAAAALLAAAERDADVKAVVSRGGRVDLAPSAMTRVRAPTLLIVGERDELIVDLNEQTQSELRCHSELVIVSGATHLFEEQGALALVATHARRWFEHWLVDESATRAAQP